jgi:hypothetical protein
MVTKSFPAMTDKQRKDLTLSASAVRPTAGLELVGSKRGLWVWGVDMKTRARYGEWSLEVTPEGVTVKATLKDYEQTWHGTIEDLDREWARIILGLLWWQKAINAIELDARAQEDPTLKHISPSTISDPAHYSILGGPEW